MLIKNKTLYDKDLILKYNQYYLSSYIKRNFIIISSISSVFIIYMLVIQEWVYALVLFGILLFYLGLTFLMQKLTTSRMLKRSPLVEQPVLQRYEFKEEEFDVINIKKYTVPYSMLLKFNKDKDFFILRTKDRKTYILEYRGFESEREKDQFESFIKEKLKSKRKAK